MKRRATVIVFVLLLYCFPGYSIVINEIVAANNSINADKDGDFSDWLELYNNASTPLSLQGFYLSDDPVILQKWPLPDVTIAPGDFLLVWCSGKESSALEWHANFKLKRDGETVFLFSPAALVVDSLSFPALPSDVAYGRFPDGANEFVLFGEPSPAAPNKAGSDLLYAATPMFSASAGFYENPLVLKLSTSTTGADIYYTLDGSEPTTSNSSFTDGITINRTTIVRAIAVKDGMAPSRIATHTFFINLAGELNELPVLSLVTDPENLWDSQTGIYANPLESGDAWERPVSVEFFEKAGELNFSTDAGIRIHGGASRLPEKSAKKSFRLYFRSEYGISKLDYPIIPSTDNANYDCLVLRAGFNDAWIHWLDLERQLTTYVRDPLIRDVYLSLGHPASHSDFAHLFLNGDYWGLYNISERYDEDFADYYFGKGDWDIVKPGPDGERNAIEAAEGDLNAWNTFYNWFRNNSLTNSSSYETLKTYVDLDSFIDFYLLNIFAQNYDWPRHNWFAARNRDNGRWIFMPWDSEFSFGSGNIGYSHSVNMWDVIEDQNSYPLPLLYGKLKNNPNFREDVAARASELWTTQLGQDHLLRLLEKRLEQIRSAIPFEADRWGDVRPPDVYDFDDWLAAGESMKNFIRNRMSVLLGQLRTEGFGTPGMDLPDGWRQQNIGDVSIEGYSFYETGLFSISGSGLDIWNTEDEFYFVWKTVPGDLDISARILSLTASDAWAKAGIMVRESLYNNSKNVYVAATPDKVTFQRRALMAGTTVSTKIENTTVPRWVRLTRQGDLFTAFESTDGITWNQVDQATISLRNSAMVGLAVTSHNDGQLCTATIDNVKINGIMTDMTVDVDLPVDFELLPNYPNPFNPETTIVYRLSTSEQVSLAVYDVAGKLVQVLVNEKQSTGTHRITFRAADLASGVYVSRLKVNGRITTGKMLLVR